ncbi:hypothetical protein OG613_20460 [Streptomyces sp. NBC_00015]|uniref:hypothetical protein n=1 Tax=unclassified Streptomyces TaxID=2593676 RepID=UPI0022586D0D|nr:hypothetical protein [Streptomyces sp. NBC_00103]MCX5373174.1 hypothetical protein [Streptomyces sp. NBC_00103]
MKNFNCVKRTTLNSAAVACSLALAASVAAIGTAHSAATVKVVITGTVSCAQDSTPDKVTITTKKGQVIGSDEMPGEQQIEQYTITLTGIPSGGTKVTARAICVDDDDPNDKSTLKKKDVPIKKPENNGPLTLNFP